MPLLKMSPDDATTHGLREGDLTAITSAHGTVEAQVTVDRDIRSGVVQLPHAWPETNVEHLFTSEKVDPLSTQPQLSAIPVSVTPVT